LKIEAVKIDTLSFMYAIDVTITNRKTSAYLPVMTHMFKSNNTSDDLSNLRNNFNTFNGVFEIIANNHVVSKAIIVDGSITQYERYAYAGDYQCTFDGITTCADDEINDMNWIQYAFCAVTAPECLAEIYLSCLWDNC